MRDADVIGVAHAMPTAYRISLAAKLGAVFLAFVLLAVTSALLVDSLIRSSQGIAQTVDIAGQQRMLSQKIAYVSHNVVEGDERSLQDLHELFSQFEQNIDTLERRALLEQRGPPSTWLAPTPSLEDVLGVALRDIRAEWPAFRSAALTVASNSAPATEVTEAHRELSLRAERMLDTTEGVVADLTSTDVRRQADVRRRAQLLLATNVLILVAGYLAVKRRVIRPITEISAAARQMAAGSRSVRTAWRSHDELGELAVSFDHMAEEVEHVEVELTYLTHHDALTGLFNRRRLEEELKRQVAHGMRHDEAQGALLLLDLDNFKDVNDAFGHPAGDALLKQVSAELKSRLRRTDVLARLGGDEFAVVLPHTLEYQAAKVAKDLLYALSSSGAAFAGKNVRLQASVGLALYPQHGTTVEELLSNVDHAMYRSKEKGGNQWSLYSGEKDARTEAESRLSHAQRLRDALEHGTTELYLQPILDLATHAINRYEVLLRVPDKEGRLLAPGPFLAEAERSNLIHAVDRSVVSSAIRLIAEHGHKDAPLSLNVNLSGRSLVNEDLLPFIQQELASSGIDPSLLVLEVTETAAITHVNQAINFIHSLKDLGCRFALDDFGVGFSSFAILKHLPVDYLKIDGSFIRNLSHDLADQHLVKAIADVAAHLNMQTIAEFVEDDHTLSILQQCGVDFAQGYHVGLPGAVQSYLGDEPPAKFAGPPLLAITGSRIRD